MKLARRLSLRVRLTVGAVIIAAVFFAATEFLVRFQLESTLRDSSVILLQSDAAPFQQELADGRGDSLDLPGQGQLVAVIDPVGAVALSTFPAELEPQLNGLAAGGRAPQEVVTPAASYLVIARDVTTPTGVWHVVTARNEAASELTVDNLTRASSIGLIILTVLVGLASWALASAALAPVAAMRRTAIRLRNTASNELLPVGPARDELQALARTLNDLITQLRASADREKQLVSDASHELRTPLAILQTQLELAHLSAGDPAALLGEIESAERTVKRLSTLASSLLELTRIEALTQQARTASESTSVTAMGDELVDAIDRARLLAIGADVVIDYEIEPLNVGAVDRSTVALSTHNFGRVVDNLLGNAVTAMQGTGSVQARLSVAGAPVVLRLEISDNGPGMAPEFLPLAFDRFTREDWSRTAPNGHAGAGLGLSIVSALVHSAGGTVTMTNRLPRGLSVVVEVPIASPGTAAITAVAPPAVSPAPIPQEGHS